jgi:hypothetical protein
VTLVGALAIAGSALAILLPTLPSIALQLAGFRPVEPSGTSVASAEIPILLESTPSDAFSFHLNGDRALDLPPELLLYLQAGIDETGAEIAQMWLGSQDIELLCARLTQYCSENGSPIRRGSAQLLGKQLLVSGEAFIDVLNRWQSFQLFLRFGPDAAVQLDSIALEGNHYSIPETGLGRFLRDLEAKVNRALRDLTVRHSATTFKLESLGVSGDQLVVTFLAG